VHAIQRGNNRNVIFASDSDMAAYVHWLQEGAAKFDVAIHGWVLMTNHVHLLLTPGSDHAVSKLFQYLGRLYVRYFNFAYARSGTLFEGRFKSSLVQQDRYFLSCLRYIELNPVRAGMVTDPSHYRWSSYRVHAHGLKVPMWTAHETYLSLDRQAAQRQARYRALINEALDQAVISKIRHCASGGLVLGNESFRSQIASLRS
jgi:putative transposase